MASVRDVKFQSSSDWFLFHLSHLEDFQFSTLETLWPQCEKCRAVYESLVYTSTEGEFGLMTKEILENLAKVGTHTQCARLVTGLRWRSRQSKRLSPLSLEFDPRWGLHSSRLCEKSKSTLCRKSWVFSGCFGFLPQGKLTGWVRTIGHWKVPKVRRELNIIRFYSILGWEEWYRTLLKLLLILQYICHFFIKQCVCRSNARGLNAN